GGLRRRRLHSCTFETTGVMMSSTDRPNPSRRRFVLWSLTGAGSAALWTLGAGTRQSRAVAAAAQRVSPDEALAKALGYTENATKVDHSKFPTYMPDRAAMSVAFSRARAVRRSGP